MSDKARYFEEASTWALDRQAAQARAVSVSRIVAIVAVFVAALEALALVALTPLKTVSAVPILVDRQTGYVQVLAPDGRQAIRANDALTQSLVARYVLDREHFDVADLQSSYRAVALWSAGDARREYLATMPAANPASPLRLYPRTTVVEARIKSVSPLGREVALVRFETRRHDEGGVEGKPQAFASVVSYRFSDAPMRFEDRLINPLGFQVTRYRRDPEAVIDRPTPEPRPDVMTFSGSAAS